MVQIIIYFIISMFSRVESHSCEWHCPYTGIFPDQYHSAIERETGSERGTDAYVYDLIHLEHPTLTYDEIEELSNH